MPRALVIALAVVTAAGCRSSTSHGSRTVTVNAFGGEVAEPGATVIGSAPDGTVIDQTAADAVGRATIGVDDDSLISVVFPGNLSTLTPAISVITVPAAADELTIHGPPASGPPPLIVGALQVDGPSLGTATYFEIRIGCAAVRVTKLPAAIDVGACSMGSDTQLDVLVAGYHDLGGDPPAPQLDGYAAGRVAMIDGIATFTIGSWQTSGTSVPVTLAGVTPVIDLALLSDGLVMDSQPVVDHGTVWTGLVVDASRLTASLAGVGTARMTTRELPGAPTAIDFTASDFLAPIAVTTAIARLAPTTLTWDAAALGDTVNLHVTWELSGAATGIANAVPTGPHRVVWDAVLPPEATTVTLPQPGGDLEAAIEPVNIAPTDVLLRYVDSAAHDGFLALLADGIHAEETRQASTIAPRPISGDIRVSHAVGLR